MATVALESLLYGIFLVLFSTNLYLRVSRYASPSQRARVWRNPVVVSTMAICATCTAHWILTLYRFFRAFLRSPGPRGAFEFYADETQTTLIVRNALTELTVIIGDAVIIHRLWLIWNRNSSVAVIPIISWLGVLATTIAIIAIFAQLGSEMSSSLPSIEHWLTANWALIAFTNIYCTALISWRIWRTGRETKGIGGAFMMHVLAILLESAALWTAWGLFYVITYQMGSILQVVATDLTPPVVGLVNMLIHLRVALGSSSSSPLEAQMYPPSELVLTNPASIFGMDVAATRSDTYYLDSGESTSTAAPGYGKDMR